MSFEIQRVFGLIVGLVCMMAASASDQLGTTIVRGVDHFEFTYRIEIPALRESGRLWIPVAQSGPFQEVELMGVTSRKPWEFIEDKDFGNRVLTMSVSPGDSQSSILLKYRVRRLEKGDYKAAIEEDIDRHLLPERLVPNNAVLGRIGQQQIATARSEREKGKALFEHVVARMAYDKTGEGWGRGDAMHACDIGRGNCTDYHAYFIALARSQGLAARFAIGFSIPAAADSGALQGYHCWAEFLADGKWVPVDISEADKDPALAEYYFGHHPANRLEVSVGRDIKLDPSPSTGPINFLIYPLLEFGGNTVSVRTSFCYTRTLK